MGLYTYFLRYNIFAIDLAAERAGDLGPALRGRPDSHLFGEEAEAMDVKRSISTTAAANAAPLGADLANLGFNMPTAFALS